MQIQDQPQLRGTHCFCVGPDFLESAVYSNCIHHWIWYCTVLYCTVLTGRVRVTVPSPPLPSFPQLQSSNHPGIHSSGLNICDLLFRPSHCSQPICPSWAHAKCLSYVIACWLPHMGILQSFGHNVASLLPEDQNTTTPLHSTPKPAWMACLTLQEQAPLPYLCPSGGRGPRGDVTCSRRTFQAVPSLEETLGI